MYFEGMHFLCILILVSGKGLFLLAIAVDTFLLVIINLQTRHFECGFPLKIMKLSKIAVIIALS